MKRTLLSLLVITLAAAPMPAATPGSDAANDPAYDADWTSGDDGGTPATFGPWTLTSNDGSTTGDPPVTNFAGFFIGNSTAGGSGDINAAGESFAVYANPGAAFADAVRGFDAPLLGQTFSFDLAVNFRNGNKGFDLRDASNATIFNLNIGGDNYAVNNVSSGGGQIFGGAYAANTVFSIQLTQTDATTGTWTITRSGGLSGTASGTYSGQGSSFKFYVAGTVDGNDANNLYFNNLAVTAIPEPSTVSLLVASALFGGCFYARRRSR